jgi:hypothetical protein
VTFVPSGFLTVTCRVDCSIASTVAVSVFISPGSVFVCAPADAVVRVSIAAAPHTIVFNMSPPAAESARRGTATPMPERIAPQSRRNAPIPTTGTPAQRIRPGMAWGALTRVHAWMAEWRISVACKEAFGQADVAFAAELASTLATFNEPR